MRYLLQHTKLLNLLNILTNIIYHPPAIVKHNRETIIWQSLNTFYARKGIHLFKRLVCF